MNTFKIFYTRPDSNILRYEVIVTKYAEDARKEFYAKNERATIIDVWKKV